MKIRLQEPFLRACAGLSAEDRAALFQCILELKGALSNPSRHTGAGLRKLVPSAVWDVRVGLSLRALFRLAQDEATFVFLGTHDEVRRFLRAL